MSTNSESKGYLEEIGTFIGAILSVFVMGIVVFLLYFGGVKAFLMAWSLLGEFFDLFLWIIGYEGDMDFSYIKYINEFKEQAIENGYSGLAVTVGPWIKYHLMVFLTFFPFFAILGSNMMGTNEKPDSDSWFMKMLVYQLYCQDIVQILSVHIDRTPYMVGWFGYNVKDIHEDV